MGWVDGRQVRGVSRPGLVGAGACAGEMLHWQWCLWHRGIMMVIITKMIVMEYEALTCTGSECVMPTGTDLYLI